MSPALRGSADLQIRKPESLEHAGLKVDATFELLCQLGMQNPAFGSKHPSNPRTNQEWAICVPRSLDSHKLSKYAAEGQGGSQTAPTMFFPHWPGSFSQRSFVFIDIPGLFLQKSLQQSAFSCQPALFPLQQEGAAGVVDWHAGALPALGATLVVARGRPRGPPYGYAVVCFHRHSRFVPSNSQCSIRAAALQTGHA